MAASMAEIDQTVTTWPQLAGDVTLGAATVAAAVRRIGRGESLPSGRLRIDMQQPLRGARRSDCFPDTIADAARPTPPTPPVGTHRRGRSSREPGSFGRQHANPGASRPTMIESSGSISYLSALLPWTCSSEAAMSPSARRSSIACCAASAHARLGPVELFPHGTSDEHIATMHFRDSNRH